MMGREAPRQAQLFYTGFNLERRVRADHPLLAIASRIDFDFSYTVLAGRYGSNGNVSVPPPVILKLMLPLVFYNVRSDRSCSCSANSYPNKAPQALYEHMNAIAKSS